MKKTLTILTLITLSACSSIPDKINDDKVFFAFDSAVISNAASENLEEQSLYMKKNPEIGVILEGHCDERGSTEYNLALEAMRAGNATQVMIKDRIKEEKIKTISYGKERPQYPGTGEAVWAKNRNVTTKVIE